MITAHPHDNLFQTVPKLEHTLLSLSRTLFMMYPSTMMITAILNFS